MRPIEVVRKFCPRAKASYLAAFESGDDLFRKAGIDTPKRLAHFLAQVFHECGALAIEHESGDYSEGRIREIFGWNAAEQKWNHSAHVTDAEAARLAHNGPALFERVYGLGNPRKHDLGNAEPGDGWRYRGTGMLQTTGRANFRRMGQKCGVDFENHPDLILSAAHALKPALAEWTEGNLNAAADRDDIEVITRKINGGLIGLRERRDWYARIRPVIGRVDLTGPAPRQEPQPLPAPTPVPPPTPIPPITPPVVTPAKQGLIATILAAIFSAGVYFRDHPAILIVGALALAGIGVLIWRLWKRK